MNRVRELIDASRDALPAQLAIDLLDACRGEDEAPLYRIVYTEVVAVSESGGSITLLHEQKTQLVEAVDVLSERFLPAPHPSVAALLARGEISRAWVHKTRPFTEHTRSFDHVSAYVVHSITPYVPGSATSDGRATGQ